VTLTPPRVTVTVDLTDQRNERTVPVNPTFSGTPAAGFQLDSLVPTPSQVTLTGDPQQLRNILNVPTEPVSVDGLKQTTTVTTHLVTSQLPSGITVKGNVSDVQVQINISEITSTAQFKPRVQPINVHAGLQATLVPEDVTVTLRGTREQLNQYGSSLAALVNLAQYSSPIGPTDVDVTIQLPPNSGLTVDKVEPKSVQVTLTTPPTPTPAPTATPLPTPTPRPTTPPTVAPTP
jgi:YbbR domain-containing protein